MTVVRAASIAKRAAASAVALALMVGSALAAFDVSKASSNFGIFDLTLAELAQRKIRLIEMGDLVLPTGRIVVADPLVTPDRVPLTRTVDPGRYPVTLYESDGRIALAALRFAPGKPVRWELATIPGQYLGDLKEGEIFGYPVDAGLGCFMDKAAYARMQDREALAIEKANSADINYYDDVLAPELTANGDLYAMHRPIAEDDVNMAIFSSGWGDGFYASFWGLDAQGKPLLLMTDFQFLENAGEPARPSGAETPQ